MQETMESSKMVSALVLGGRMCTIKMENFEYHLVGFCSKVVFL